MIWIQTHTGKAFDLEHPTPEMVDIIDIGHALSNLCRFCGHTRIFYSVAEHSVMMALKEPEIAVHALLHDAAEAYVGDITTPLKSLLPEIEAIEARILYTIYEAFGVPCPVGPEEDIHSFEPLRNADRRMAATEVLRLLKQPPPLSWGEWVEGVQPYEGGMTLLPRWLAKEMWIEGLEMELRKL